LQALHPNVSRLAILGIMRHCLRAGIVHRVSWYRPQRRGILPVAEFHVPRRFLQFLRHSPFELRWNTAFGDVMRGCADREETWITDAILDSYEELHRLGFAHSAEVWRGGRLMGGVYGVAIGGAFFGESMFHTMTDASKVALAHLVARLGGLQAQVDRAQTRNESEAAALGMARTGMVQIDPYDAATRLQNTETQLQLIYTLTARISRLSLADYL
jgi:leucyl/phenylalanyl-tRNA--protein transferase